MIVPNFLWTAILDLPHDDEPRLRLAEWFDERDDLRGEFIRLQCQLERLPLANPLRLELEAREHELLADHETEWLGPLDDYVQWAVFHRGFATEVALDLDQFLRHGDAIVDLAPIHMVHLSGCRDRIGELARCEALRRVTFLDLSNNHLRDKGVALLAESPNVGNLEGLNLSSAGVGDGGARALAASDSLVGLRELYLCDNRITRAGVRALAHSRLVGQLEVLTLRYNECENSRHMLRSDPVLMLQF